MRKLLLLLGLLALSPDLGSASVAHAAAPATFWKIRIDNWANPDKPAYWGTDDDIDISLCTLPVPPLFPCFRFTTLHGPLLVSSDLDIYVSSNSMPLDKLGSIRLETTGHNMFVVDQLEIYDEAGVLKRTFGADNMEGYCLSTDAKDGKDPACGASHVASCGWAFDHYHGTTRPSCQ